MPKPGDAMMVRNFLADPRVRRIRPANFSAGSRRSGEVSRAYHHASL